MLSQKIETEMIRLLSKEFVNIDNSILYMSELMDWSFLKTTEEVIKYLKKTRNIK